MIIVIFPEQEGNKMENNVASNVFNLKFIFTFNSQDLIVNSPFQLLYISL